jgi:hypothetical protein
LFFSLVPVFLSFSFLSSFLSGADNRNQISLYLNITVKVKVKLSLCFF